MEATNTLAYYDMEINTAVIFYGTGPKNDGAGDFDALFRNEVLNDQKKIHFLL